MSYRRLGIAEEAISAHRPLTNFRLLLAEFYHVERDLKLLFGLHTGFLYFWRYDITVCSCVGEVFRLRTQRLPGSWAEDDRLAGGPVDGTKCISDKHTIV